MNTPSKTLVDIDDILQEVSTESAQVDFRGFQPESILGVSAPPESQQTTFQANTVARESRVRLRWEDRLSQLKDFKAKYGHVDVPRSYVRDPSLATFVCNQRQTYRRSAQGKGPRMDQRRVEQLEAIGFKWVVPLHEQKEIAEDDAMLAASLMGAGTNNHVAETSGESEFVQNEGLIDDEATPGTIIQAVVRRCRTLDWEEGIGQLMEFQAQNSHLDVPHIYAANQPLGNFVKNIRQHYKQMQKGKASNFLKPERVSVLKNMGFKLMVRQRKPWGGRFEELKEYINNHGNCDVPKHTPLGIWVLNQRSQYKLLKANKSSQMTEERINALNSVGFDWRITRKSIQLAKPMRTTESNAMPTSFNSSQDIANAAILKKEDDSEKAESNDIGKIGMPNGGENVSLPEIPSVNVLPELKSDQGRFEENGNFDFDDLDERHHFISDNSSVDELSGKGSLSDRLNVSHHIPEIREIGFSATEPESLGAAYYDLPPCDSVEI